MKSNQVADMENSMDHARSMDQLTNVGPTPIIEANEVPKDKDDEMMKGVGPYGTESSRY